MAEKKGRPHPTSYDALFTEIGKMKIERQAVLPLERRPTGIISLDLPFHGGLPVGRTVLWYGIQGSGKSTTWMLVARQMMRRGEPVLWIDAERTMDRNYAELLGIDVDAVAEDGKPLFDLLRVNTAEAVMDIILMALELKRHKLIVLDTLAKLTPIAEESASLSKNHMGLHARLYSSATRVWSEPLDKSGATLVLLNQERIDMGSYGAPKISGGGKAISEHEPTIVVYTARNEPLISKDGELQGLIFRFNIKKSKAFPFVPKYSAKDFHQIRIACAPDRYEIDYPYELFTAAKTLGVLLNKDGGVWEKNVAHYNGEKLGNGETQVLAFFAEKTDLRDEIEQDVISRIESGQYRLSSTPSEVSDDEEIEEDIE